MITRIVKMSFQKGSENDFLAVFRANEDKIRAFKGCKHLELWRDVHEPGVFFTYSIWDSETDLLMYRSSALFEKTWSAVSVMFSEKAEAWTLEKQ